MSESARAKFVTDLHNAVEKLKAAVDPNLKDMMVVLEPGEAQAILISMWASKKTELDKERG
jgi:hypothetical protein